MAGDFQYGIDIAAKSDGIDSAVGRLTAAEKALQDTGAAADTAGAELANISKRYDELAVAADKAAKDLERAGAATKGAVPIDLKQKADAAAQALAAEAAALDKAKAAADTAGAAHVRAATQLKTFTDAADANREKMLSGINESDRWAPSMSTLATGASMAAAGIGALAVGTAALTIAAIDSHDELAKQQAQLKALAGDDAPRADQAINDLATSLGITDDQLRPLAQQLLAMGTPIDQLSGKLKALAAQQALGMGGDQAIVNALTKLGEGVKLNEKALLTLTQTAGITGEALAGKLGISAEKFRQQLKAGTLDSKALADAILSVATDKGMPALEAQSKSLKQKIDNVKDSFGDMLGEAINTDAATGAIDEFGKLLDKNTATGQEMRKTLSAIFSDTASAATKAAPVVIDAVSRMTHAVAGLVDFLHDPSLSTFAMIGEAEKKAAKTVDTNDVKGSAAEQLAQLEAKYAALQEKAKSEMGLFSGPSKETTDQAAVLEGEIAQAKKALEAQKGDSTAVGGDVASGYAAGIRAGIPDVAAANAEMAAAGQAALAAANDSHSPSRKYRQQGLWGGEGYALGWDDSAPIVRSALSRVGGPVTVPALGGGGAAAAARASALVENLHIEVHAGGEDLATQVRIGVVEGLQDIARQLGGRAA